MKLFVKEVHSGLVAHHCTWRVEYRMRALEAVKKHWLDLPAAVELANEIELTFATLHDWVLLQLILHLAQPVVALQRNEYLAWAEPKDLCNGDTTTADRKTCLRYHGNFVQLLEAALLEEVTLHSHPHQGL